MCARTHTHTYIQTYAKLSYARSFWNNTYVHTSAKEKKETDNEETNLQTLEIYAVPRAHICVMYVPRGPRDLNNIVRESKYMVRRKDGLMCINITLRAHERTIPHASVFSSQQLNSTSNSTLLVCHTALTGKTDCSLVVFSQAVLGLWTATPYTVFPNDRGYQSTRCNMLKGMNSQQQDWKMIKSPTKRVKLVPISLKINDTIC